MEDNELKTILKMSIEDFYEKDYYLVENGLHEQAQTASLKFHIESVISETFGRTGYKIDNEYNKFLNNNKEFYKQCKDCNKNDCMCKISSDATGRPDIIIHVRGETGTDNNALAIEVKKKDEPDNDKKKLTYLTCNNSQYNYQLGAFVVLEKERVTITYFKDGKKQENEDTANVSTNAYGLIEWE